MSKVTVSIVTVAVDLPSGVVAGALRVNLHDTAGAVLQTVDIDSGDAVFSNVNDGSYTVTAVRLDSANGNLGNKVSQAFDVGPAVPLTYQAPSGLTVVVSAD